MVKSGLNTANIQEGLTEIIVLLMQSTRTDGEVYGARVFLCVQGRERETADFAVMLRDRWWTKMDLLSVLFSFSPIALCPFSCHGRRSRFVV